MKSFHSAPFPLRRLAGAALATLLVLGAHITPSVARSEDGQSGARTVPTQATAPTATSTLDPIKAHDGIRLHLQKDLPASPASAVLVISHGLASHSGVFGDLARTMNQNGIAVYRFDHRGHGRSDGKGAQTRSFFELADDLDIVIRKAKAENPGKPVFVLGHSMGGHVAALSGTRTPGLADGYILAAGVLRYHQMNFGHLPRPEPADSLVNCTEAAHGTLNLPTSNKGGDLSLPDDPLMLKECPVSLINAFQGGLKYLKENSYRFADPVLLVSGDADLYVVPQDAIDFYNQTNSRDRSLRLYSGIGHLLFLEPGGDIVTRDIADWITRHVAR